ncbi:MAG: hypothetical protein NVSMB17_15040 [Candidatus Dormibacteria bacterium]
MDVVPSPAEPIGFAELGAGVAAVLFALLTGAGLVAAVVGQTAAVAATPNPGGVAAPTQASSCSNAPRDPLAMRLGRSRAYPAPVSIDLEPVPFSEDPPITAEDAYRRSGQRLSGCETEELLAYYSASSPAARRVMSWVLVSALPCPSSEALQRQCYSISPVDATTGALMGTRIFQLPQ